MSNINREELYLGALLHHSPLKDDAIVQKYKEILDKADKYATANQGINLKKHDFVASPFENLKRKPLQNKIRFGFQSLNLSNDFFPSESPKHTSTSDKDNLWDKFGADVSKYAQQGDAKLKAETILSLLQKYTVTIPNPTSIHPEVSWYDYTKIKAGLAVCLQDVADKPNDENKDKPLLIIRADISGIQDFIGNIASKNASKNLKGRSFYVQLLVNTVLKLMLKKLNLFEGNVMYASGGNFFVIAPNTQFVKDAFCAFEKEITAAIFKEHKTRIAVVMGYQAVSESEVLSGNINESITKLFEEVIDKKKKQKFSVLISDTIIDENGRDGYDKFFNEKYGDNGGDYDTDAITGDEVIVGNDKKYPVLGEDAIPNWLTGQEIKEKQKDEIVEVLKEATYKQIILGLRLKDLAYIIVSDKNIKLDLKKRKSYKFNPCGLGVYYYFVINEKEVKTKIEAAFKHESDYEIIKLNAPLSSDNNYNVILEKLHNTVKQRPNFTLYGGNQAPKFELDYTEQIYDKKKDKYVEESRKKGVNFKDFNHLALKLSHDKNGNAKVSQFKRLGVLKMDIDGLGSIFKSIVPYPNFDTKKDDEELYKRPHLTFSYYSALSRNLDWFFKGYLNTIWEREEFKYSTQIIYSGGDDLFIVGRWDTVTAFAKAIKDEFAKFTRTGSTNKKEQVTISGGVAIVGQKFPIMKASDMASDAEHDAKDHELKDDETIIFKKDSFNFLKTSLNWETEFKMVEQLKTELTQHVGESRNQIPKSFLGKIQIHAESAKQYKETKERYENGEISEAPNPRWIWTIIYDFSRMADRVGKSKKYDLSDKVSDLQEGINQSAKDFIRQLSRSVFTNSWNGQTIKSKYHFLELLSIAARWAEIESRTNK